MGRIGIPVELLPDETLLAGLATGEAEIAVAFVRRFQRTVYGVGIAVLGDSRLAEDVAQLTFERAWRHAEIYDARRGSVRTWLTAIAHNLAIDMVRAHQPTPLDPGDLAAQFTAVVDSPERLAAAHEDASALQTGLTALPVPQARAGHGRHLRHDRPTDRRHRTHPSGHGENPHPVRDAQAAGLAGRRTSRPRLSSGAPSARNSPWTCLRDCRTGRRVRGRVRNRTLCRT